MGDAAQGHAGQNDLGVLENLGSWNPTTFQHDRLPLENFTKMLINKIHFRTAKGMVSIVLILGNLISSVDWALLAVRPEPADKSLCS